MATASNKKAPVNNPVVYGGTIPALQPVTGDFDTQMKMLSFQLEETKRQIKRNQDLIKSLSGRKDAKSKKALATAQGNLKLYQGRETSLAGKISNLQTTHWQETGQYDQLLQGEGRDAYMALSTLFNQYGLGSLAGKIYEYVKSGYGADTISILLQDSPEYKRRFAANDARLKAGMSVLSPSEYISVENSYRQIMRQSGLPIGFYDSNDDFTKWIASDVSPTEIQSRVELATQATALASPSYKQALRQMGLSDGEMAAYFLDADRALPFIQKSAATAAIGAEALQRGFAFDQQYAENLATQGISREQAAQGYAKIGDEFSDLTTLGQIYGGGWTQRQAEEDVFTGGTEAGEQRRRLVGRERAQFSGPAGTARAGLAQRGGAR